MTLGPIAPAMRALLLTALEDWVDLAGVISVVRLADGAETDEEVKEKSLALIEAACEAQWVEIGDVTDAGFFDWEEPPEAAIARIRREWNERGSRPGLWQICWLSLTPTGESVAEEVLATTGPLQQNRPK